jgi:hypothetical protein
MKPQNGSIDLRAIAHKAMTDRGLEPDFPPDALQQLAGIHVPARESEPGAAWWGSSWLSCSPGPVQAWAG